MPGYVFLRKSVPPDSSVFTAVALFWLGMLFQEHGGWLEFGIIKTILAIAAAAAVLFVPLPFYGNVLPWKNLLGIALFYLLINLFSRIPYGDSRYIPFYWFYPW